MALITSFEKSEGNNLSRHKTDVYANVFVFGSGPRGPIFQVNTYGSAERAMPDKVSQTFQLDRRGAETLWKMLGQTYGFR